MCLDTVDKEIDIPKGCNYGWKVFGFLEKGELGLQYIPTTNLLPMNVWVNEGNYRDKYSRCSTYVPDSEPKYPLGFHLYLNKDDAVTARNIKKVFFRKVVATGTQWCSKVIVAKEIFICSNRDMKKPVKRR